MFLKKTSADLIVYASCLSFDIRYKELKDKLILLEQNTIQRDRTEALLKQKEKDYIQVRTHKHYLSFKSLGTFV